jgi:AraC family transcriptional regulator of adaptative response/methylated-DNA-[protein]-cysteine methyltransferase
MPHGMRCRRATGRRFFYGCGDDWRLLPAGLQRARMPLRANARFFLTAEEARPQDSGRARSASPPLRGAALWTRFVGISKRISTAACGLKNWAAWPGLSPFTVQRLFKREMGVSPLEYQRALRAGRLRGALKQGDTVTDAIYKPDSAHRAARMKAQPAGHDACALCPGRQRRANRHATARTPFGWMIVGSNGARPLLAGAGGNQMPKPRRPCAPNFLRRRCARSIAQGAWSMRRSRSVREGDDLAKGKPAGAHRVARSARNRLSASRVAGAQRRFRAAKRAPTASWRARWAFRNRRAPWPGPAPSESRVALWCPCHRVVGASGSLTGYRWGVERKRQAAGSGEATARQLAADLFEASRHS